VDKLRVRIKKLRENAILPEYQTEHSAGMDLHVCIDEPMIIQPLGRAMVPTGIAIELPIGYEAQVRARSGLSLKNGITMANGIGTVDSDYRGELGVLVVNLGDEPFTIESGMRIAQMVVTRFDHVVWDEVEHLSETKRGAGGYGSTGK
jgi:dUTP pyrophosphatase